MSRLWVCPTCSSSRRGPEKPRRDDVCRYCFPCSEKAGRLAERACPSLDREREERAERAKERHEREKLRDKERAEALKKAWPNELLQAFEAWKRLQAWGPRSGLVGRELHLRTGRKPYSTGSYYGNSNGALMVTAGTDRALAYLKLVSIMACCVDRRNRFPLMHAAVQEVVGRTFPLDAAELRAHLAVWLDEREERGLPVGAPSGAKVAICTECRSLDGRVSCGLPDCGCDGFHPCPALVHLYKGQPRA